MESRFAKCIKRAARAKQWDVALSLFAEANTKGSAVDAPTFNATLNACVVSKKWVIALHLAEMEQYKVGNKYVFATCMRGYGEATLWHVAIAEMAEQLNSTAGIEIDDVIFGVCITNCGRAMEWRWALQLLEELRSRPLPQVEGEKLTLFACERGSAWMHALKLLEGLGDRSSYNSAISSCGKALHWISSMNLVAEMQQQDILPDSVTWNCLLSSLEKGGQWQRALTALWQVTCSRMGYNATISACANASAWKQALAVFEGVDKDAVTFNAAITACSKGRQISRSLRLFEEMKVMTVSPDIVTLGAVLNACEKGTSWAEAVNLLQKDSMRSIVLLNTVASSCGKGHQWQRALWILRKVTNRHRLHADSTTFNTVMAACLRGEEWERSLSLFRELCLNSKPTVSSYAEALGSFHQAQKWEAALQTFLEVPAADLHVLGATLRACSVKWQQALLFLNEHLEKADSICTLLTLTTAEQAGQIQWSVALTRKLHRDALKCAKRGETRVAEATAVNLLLALGLMHAGDATKEQELEHCFRSFCKTVYMPALQHCRGHRQMSSTDEWSSFEVVSRDAIILLGVGARFVSLQTWRKKGKHQRLFAKLLNF